MTKRANRVAAATRPAELTDEQIAHALRLQRGNISAAAEALGVARSTIHRRINTNPELDAICTDARENLIDVAENALLKLINEGNVAAVIFALKTQGRSRGYSERLEITGKDGEAIAVKGYIGFSPEEWDKPEPEADCTV